MNSRVFTLHERLQWDPLSGSPEDLPAEQMDDLLERCIERCDDFATVIQEAGVTHEIFDLLGECVVACGQFMAAHRRESFLESQYAFLCADVCESTAALCAKLDCETSRACRRACLACATKIRSEFQHAKLN